MKFTKSTIIPTRRSRLRNLLCLLCVLALLPVGALATAVSSVPTLMRVALISAPDVQIYPLQVMDRDINSMLSLVYESLVVIDDSRQPAEGLATWEMKSDGKSWTFKLREGVIFHDGRELTAYDVAATLDAIKAIANSEVPDNQKGRYISTANIVSAWTVDDKYTISIRTNRPFYGFLYAMTFPILQAQSAMLPNPPGTGPYRLEYYVPGETMWLAGNQNWYGQAPHISEIIGNFYATEEAALAAFEAEDVDIVMTRSTAAVRYRGTASSRINSYDYATQQLECLLMNAGTRLLRDQGLREAIAYAINKTRLTGGVYQNLVTTTDTLQSPASWLYHDPDPTLLRRYNVEKANELLDSLGWDTYNDKGYRTKRSESGEVTVLELRLNYYDEAGNALRKEAASEIAKMLSDVGIYVKLSGQSFETAQSKLSPRISDYDLYLCAFNFDVVPDPNFLLLRDGYANYARYRSDDMDKLCKELRESADAEQFKLTWGQIQLKLIEEIPFIPLYWRNGVVLTRYPYSSVRDIREFEVLKSINEYR